MGVFFQPWWGSTFFGKTSSSVLQRCSPSFLSPPSLPSPRLLSSLQESVLPPVPTTHSVGPHLLRFPRFLWGCYPGSSEGCEAPTLPCLHCQPPSSPRAGCSRSCPECPARQDGSPSRTARPHGRPRQGGAAAGRDHRHPEVLGLSKNCYNSTSRIKTS